ncbi:MAG TPA: PDZ domain-containing protein, partial [Pseudomonadota bacterium]|nr:PDZ domain-containing protein [Pseudomonadota bacterium]
GGPLVNLNGEVIGINTAILGPGGNIGIGFAVPSDMAKPIARELIASGKVRRPFLGISMQPYTSDMAKALGAPEKGALVGQLTSGAPAEKAGVRRGDVIVKVDGKPVTTSRDVQRYVLARRVGDSIGLEVWRDGKLMALQAKTAELPGEEGGASASAADDGQAGKAKLGLGLQTLSPQLAERFGLKAQQGALINGVRPGSPAAESGLLRGDVIIEVDRRPVHSADDVVRALSTERAGGHVLLVQRGEQSMFVLLQAPPK